MIGILGLVIIIVATIYAYKTAKDYDRNAVLWAIITFSVGFGIQIIIPFIIGIILAIVLMAGGTSPEKLEEAVGGWVVIIGMVCLVLSVAAVFIILRYLSKIPEEKPFTPPPQPPTFG